MKKKIYLILTVTIMAIIISAGSYAYWIWNSDENKNIVFNTSSDLKDYIIYDEGESKFVGDFKIGSTYLDGVHTTISIYKIEEAKDVDMYATINMRINDIGENLKNFSGLKWTLTEGNATSNGEVLASGNFLGYNINDTIELKTNIEVLTELKEYTVWLWLDENENPTSELTGETVDTSIWTQVNQLRDETFEILSVNYIDSELHVSVINKGAKITHYQFTSENVEPTEWLEIASDEIDYKYTLKYSESLTGKSYVWFKDENGKIIKSLVDTVPPTAPTTMNYVFGDWSLYTDDTWTNKIVYVASNEENPGPSGATDLESGIDKYQISKDNKTWEDYNYVVNNYLEDEMYVLASNGTHIRYFRACDKAGNCGPSISRTAKVDRDGPYGRVDLSLNNGVYTVSLADSGDEGSGLNTTYGFSLISSGSCSSASYTNQTGTSKTYSGSYTSGTTYYGCIKLTDNVGNVSYISSSGVKYSRITGETPYTTSGSYTFLVDFSGTYKLEVWGAQGGTANSYRGGYGGYSVGNVNLTEGTVLYVVVGAQGFSGMPNTGIVGGSNGGGWAGVALENNTNRWVAGGGGATHIATKSGNLSDLSGSISNILIVAGGGGGGYQHSTSGYYGVGGDGGGFTGVSGHIGTAGGGKYGTGGTQTSAGCAYGTSVGCGSFGTGGNVPTSSAVHGSGGGGGFYGGGASNGGTLNEGNSSGGGGSGYIGNSLLINKYMYCYNCATSSATNTKTYTTTNVSSTPTSNYAKSGSGAAKITWDIVTNQSSLVLTYNNNGGSGCHSKSITNGLTYGELCTPIKTEYSFDGWYTSATGGTKITSTTTVSSTTNQTVYAHWIPKVHPNISFGTDGNTDYVSGDVSSTIIVSKNNNDLDPSSYKYIWSTDENAIPNLNFTNGNSYTLENSTGIYYLIVRACDVNGYCITRSSKAFHVDNSYPTGSISGAASSNAISATLSVSDTGSGLSGTYGWKISTNNVCNSSTTGFTNSSNKTYTFMTSSTGTYYVCAKVSDVVGNTSYLLSNAIRYSPNANISKSEYLNISYTSASSGVIPGVTYYYDWNNSGFWYKNNVKVGLFDKMEMSFNLSVSSNYQYYFCYNYYVSSCDAKEGDYALYFNSIYLYKNDASLTSYSYNSNDEITKSECTLLSDITSSDVLKVDTYNWESRTMNVSWYIQKQLK